MSTFSADERIKLQRQIVDEHVRAENAHEWAAVHDTFMNSVDAYFDVVPLSTTFPGIDGVKGFYDFASEAFADFHVHVTAEYDTPGCSVRECTITGTHRSEYCGVEPKGHPLTVEMVALLLFDDEDPGKLKAERIYYDNETLLRQMRGEPDSPTGVGLAQRTH